MLPTSPNILQHSDWTFPVAIHYGPGRLSEIAGKCRDANITRPLLVAECLEKAW